MALGPLALIVSCESNQRVFGEGGSGAATSAAGSSGEGGVAASAGNAGASPKAGAGGQGGEGASANAGAAVNGGADAAGAAADGGSGTTGDAGSPSGGASAFTLGAECGSDGECASEHCVDGVCCENACDGPCENCSSQGRCDAMPTDDAACLAVTCPSDTTCRDFDAQITTGRCAALGECKTAIDCPHQDEADRTVCGEDGEVCRGGVCEYQTTECGATAACSTFCCERLDMGTRSCAAAVGSTCGNSANINDANTGLKVYCDEQADCASGEWCCLSHANNMVAIQCSSVCGATHPVGGNYILCKSPAATTACPAGASCTYEPTNSLPDDWAVCTVP